ncbi:MAG: hypothetical protein COB73_08360 [Flavobacteriaceae bacterium]|nr:MAG: hypothetical protein COB73_08360 [Flavobacteriaceae bacterium]
MKKILLSSLLLVFITFANAQETEHEETEEKSEKRHSIAVLISHTQIGETIEGEGKKNISVPSWGIDYNFEISERWAIGLHNDLILETFIIENSEGAEIERVSPLATAVVGMFKPIKNFSLVLGAGGEFSKKENLFLIKAGVEYSHLILHGNWEIITSFSNDIKFNAYNSWNLGFGIGRRF